MKIIKNKNLIMVTTAGLVLVMILGIYQVLNLRKAHSSFENYYAFRGCQQMLEKTDAYGICKTTSGDTIKIVKFQEKWYLDGDLPCGFLCF
jgi:hypothetical protein